MNIVFDIICLALLVIMTYLNGARKKGLASCLVSCVGAVAAVAIAVSLSAPVSELCSDVMFKNRIQAEVDRAVLGGDRKMPSDEAKNGRNTVPTQTERFQECLKPSVFRQMRLQERFSGQKTSPRCAGNIVENIIKPPLLSAYKNGCDDCSRNNFAVNRFAAF